MPRDNREYTAWPGHEYKVEVYVDGRLYYIDNAKAASMASAVFKVLARLMSSLLHTALHAPGYVNDFDPDLLLRSVPAAAQLPAAPNVSADLT